MYRKKNWRGLLVCVDISLSRPSLDTLGFPLPSVPAWRKYGLGHAAPYFPLLQTELLKTFIYVSGDNHHFRIIHVMSFTCQRSGAGIKSQTVMGGVQYLAGRVSLVSAAVEECAARQSSRCMCEESTGAHHPPREQFTATS